MPSFKTAQTFPSTKDVPTDIQDRVEKNIEEGRGISFGGGKKEGGVFDFASSNEMWRASIEVLDFISFTNASYSLVRKLQVLILEQLTISFLWK